MSVPPRAAGNIPGPSVLVVIPHGGLILPAEIPAEALSEDLPELAGNIDWQTEWLYDFRDILSNAHLVFPYCSLVLEANRHPRDLDSAVPLKDVLGRPVYRIGREPNAESRRQMAVKYLDPFHAAIRGAIGSGAQFFLEGHATVTARGVSDNQIDLMNVQFAPGAESARRFCPDALIQAYAEELRKRLPEAKVTVNASEYLSVYGHICAEHSIDATGRIGHRAPAILQETNQRLYRNADGTPDIRNLNRLRRAFAESLRAAIPISHD
jgi:hypothetical protein